MKNKRVLILAAIAVVAVGIVLFLFAQKNNHQNHADGTQPGGPGTSVSTESPEDTPEPTPEFTVTSRTLEDGTVVYDDQYRTGMDTNPAEATPALPSPSNPATVGEFNDDHPKVAEDETEEHASTIICNDDELYTGEYVYENRAIETDLSPVMHLRIGCETSDKTGGLYLNPSFVYENDNIYMNRAGVYLFLARSEAGVTFEYWTEEAGSMDSDLNVESKSLLVYGRTYDKLIDATYKNASRFGVCWSFRFQPTPSESGRCDTIRLLVIRASDGYLMDSVKIDVLYDAGKNSFRFGEPVSASLSSEEGFDQGLYSQLVATAQEFYQRESCKVRATIAPEYDKTLVEEVARPYFPKLFTAGGNVVRKNIIAKYDLYAVHLRIYGVGYFTFYVTQSSEVSSNIYGESNIQPAGDWAVVAYDAGYPQSVITFNGALNSTDAEEFGVQ